MNNFDNYLIGLIFLIFAMDYKFPKHLKYDNDWFIRLGLVILSSLIMHFLVGKDSFFLSIVVLIAIDNSLDYAKSDEYKIELFTKQGLVKEIIFLIGFLFIR